MSTPHLRFKEFTDAWSEKALSAVTDCFKSGQGITAGKIMEFGKYPVFGGNGLRGYSDRFTHDGFYFLIGRQGALCGNINRSFGKSFISEHAIAVNANQTSDTEWLAQRLDHFGLNRLSESSAIPGLAVGKLVALKLYIPLKAEQQKISTFLNAIDTRIDQLTQKHALLVEYKKGVMQKIFSQEVRFKDVDGNGFPPWKQCALGETSDIVMGQSPNSSSYNTDGDGLPLVQGNADISGRKTIIRSWTNDPGKVCNAGDIILTVRAPVGSVAKAAFDSCLGRGVCALQAREKYSRDFVFQMLFWFEEFRWRSVIQGAIFDAINGNDIKRLDVEIPSLPEQIKISTFLNGLDEQIERAHVQMNETKKYKQGLLQVMFV